MLTRPQGALKSPVPLRANEVRGDPASDAEYVDDHEVPSAQMASAWVVVANPRSLVRKYPTKEMYGVARLISPLTIIPVPTTYMPAGQ